MFNIFRKPAPPPSDEPPVACAELKALFDHLDRPNPPPCTQTFALSAAFLRSRDLPVDAVLAWLSRNGAGCDCDVLFNVEGEWGERVGRTYEDDEA